MWRLKYSRAITRTNICMAAVLALPGWCQQSDPTVRNHPDACLNIVEDCSNTGTRYRAIRTVEDYGTHQHWMLLQNLSRPAAPAVLIQRPLDFSCARLSLERPDLRFPSDRESLSLPVIHAGNYLIVSEHTRVLDAELEAIALRPAAIGEGLTVRLKFGGRTRNAIATAPGRATLSEEGREAHR
jgi:hypothetical protein